MSIGSFEREGMLSWACFILKMNTRKLESVSYNKSGRESNKIMIVVIASAGLRGTP